MSPSKAARSPLRILTILLALGLVGAVAGILALRATLTPERLRAEVVRATSESTGLPTSLESATLSFFPFGVSLEKLRIASDTGDSDFFSLSSALVRLQLRPLLRKSVVVDRIEVREPIVRLRKEGDQIVLPGKLGAATNGNGAVTGDGARASGAPPPVDIHVEKIELLQGALHLVSSDGTDDADLEGIDCRGSLDVREAGNRVLSKGELKLGSLALTALAPYRETLDRLDPTLDFELDYRAREGTLRMETLRLDAPPLDLRFQGDLTGLPDAPVIALVLDRETLQLGELLPLVPPSLFPEGRIPNAKGPVTVSAKVEGSLADAASLLMYDVSLQFDDAHFGMDGFDVGIDGLTGRVDARPTGITLQDLLGRIGSNGTFALNGTIDAIDRPDSTAYDLAIQSDVDLALVKRTGFLPEGTDLAGQLGVNMTAKGRAADPTGVQLGGRASLDHGVASTPDLAHPVRDLNARVRFEGADAVLDSFEGSFGSSRFRGSGRVAQALSAPRVTLEGSCPRIDVVELFPTPPPAAPTGSAPGSSPTAAPAPPLIPPMPPLPVDLKLAIDSLLTEGGKLANLTVDGRIRDEVGHFDARVGTADFDGVVLEQFTAAMDMKNSTATGTFRAPRANAHIIPMTNVQGKVDIDANDVVHVTDVTAALWSGTVSGTADVDMKDRASPAFQVNTAAKGLSADQFIEALTPATDLLSGVLDVSSSFSGKGATPDDVARSLVGQGTLDAKQGKVEKSPAVASLWKALNLGSEESIPFRDLATKFAVEEGKIKTKDLVIAGGNADWKANGFVTFDGKLDYDVSVELNDSLSQLYRQRMGGDLAKLLSDTSGRLTIDLRIHGDSQSPQVDVDTKKLAERAAENLKNKVSDDLKSGKDQLLEGLKGLVGGDSTAAADSTAPPTKVEDALKKLLGGRKK